MSSSRNTTWLFLLFFFFAFCLAGNGAYAFGAGNIPSFAFMEGRAFRHGDIEDALADLIKRGSGTGFALASILSKGSKFNGLDIKRVYFGNWLRDYSQAVDIASLKKVQLQTIINLCMALGFLAHGYATHEFEVTPDRLGCYLPTEHIDNPKGYGDGEDARKYHPKLRGPVDPRELEVDPRTGMKNYIANEQGQWDTSRALVRRTLEQCIHLGREHRSRGMKQDEYEAYRLLGQALHTLEDFPAHSNFCELSLVSMGHTEVFTHVGDSVRIQAPNGKWVAPIVTGTFGSSDFTHSLLGEATDHLSEASVSDLNKALDDARSQSTRGGPGSDPSTELRSLFTSIPGVGGEMSSEMDSVERIRAGPAAGGKNPDEMSPQELHAVLWQVLTFRDSVVKKISKTIEKIPGLGPLIDKLMDSISVFVFTTIEPFLKPILKSATAGLSTASTEVINTHDQYEVFNDPRASDPTHSFLSKDHFNLILNEPAGRLARVVVIHTVNLVVKAWDDNSVNVHQTVEDILSCLFHPDFHNGSSKIQREMLQNMRDWAQGLGNKQNNTLKRLSKQAVRNHENIRLSGEGGKPAAQGSFASNEAHQFQHQLQGYANQIPGVSQVSGLFAPGGPKRDVTGGEASGFYGAPSGPQAAAASGFPGGPPSGYQPPAGPPTSYATPPSSYFASASGIVPQSRPGYSPSYATPPSQSGGPVSFPGSAPTSSYPSSTYSAAPHSSISSPHAAFPGSAPTSSYPSSTYSAKPLSSISSPNTSFPGSAEFDSTSGAPNQFPGGPESIAFPGGLGDGGGYGAPPPRTYGAPLGPPPPMGRGGGPPSFPNSPGGFGFDEPGQGQYGAYGGGPPGGYGQGPPPHPQGHPHHPPHGQHHPPGPPQFPGGGGGGYNDYEGKW